MKIASDMRVAFQGERGAFSEEAAVKLLGSEVSLVPLSTFDAAFGAIAARHCGLYFGAYRK